MKQIALVLVAFVSLCAKAQYSYFSGGVIGNYGKGLSQQIASTRRIFPPTLEDSSFLINQGDANNLLGYGAFLNFMPIDGFVVQAEIVRQHAGRHLFGKFDHSLVVRSRRVARSVVVDIVNAHFDARIAL